MAPEPLEVIWHASTERFQEGYAEAGFSDGEEIEFSTSLRDLLAEAGEFVTFFCDDDIVFRTVPHPPSDLLQDDRVLSVALGLGQENLKQSLPSGFPKWEWKLLDGHDFGFTCGVDGFTYRTQDVLKLIGSRYVSTPTFLESIMMLNVSAISKKRPLMACFPNQCLVGVPVNRVSVSSGVPYGRRHPQSTEALNERFLRGERIDLDALDFSEVYSYHHEFEFKWVN